MKYLFAMLFAIVLTVPMVSIAQTQQVNAETAGTPSVSGITGSSSAADVLSLLKPGITYDATGPTANGVFHNYVTVKEISNRQIAGTVRPFNSGRACNRDSPFKGEGRADGTVYIESDGGLRGCERSMELKVTDGKVVGTSTGPYGTSPIITFEPKN